jgi:hypothetical protein
MSIQPWDAPSLLQVFGDLPYAVIGAVAANQYMPERTTTDIDFAITNQDQPVIESALTAAGWRKGHALNLNPPLSGWAWSSPQGFTADLLTVPGSWGQRLVETASHNLVGGLRMATLPHLVVLKLFSGRMSDVGDIGRMLGHQPPDTIAVVRALVAKLLPAVDLEDLDQIIELGRLEYGPPPFAV